MEDKTASIDKNISNDPSKDKKIDGIFGVIKKSIPLVPKPKSVWTTKNIVSAKKKTSGNSARRLIVATVLAIFVFAFLPIRLLTLSSSLSTKAENSTKQIEKIIDLTTKNDYETIPQKLDTLYREISSIDKDLKSAGQNNFFIAQFVLTQDTITDKENVFYAIKQLTEFALAISPDLITIEKNIPDFLFDEEKNNTDFLIALNNLSSNMTKNKNLLLGAKQRLSRVSDNDQRIKTIGEKLQKISAQYDDLALLVKKSPQILGKDLDRKYLLMLQNNTELRPTGGFIGSYGILTLRDGKIKNIFIDSVYNPDGQLGKEITPPDPLKKITDNWAMRDANWSPDLPTSSKYLIDFYEAEGGFTPDGIIYMDTQPFIDLLNSTGPIWLASYDLTVDGENFVSLIQYKTSIDYDKSSQNPKRFLADLAPALIEKISTLDDNGKKNIYNLLQKNIREKHIQFFSTDKETEQSMKNLGLGGSIYDGEGDYFSYINANIGGMKTNQEITESISHKIYVSTMGKTIHRVDITRRHYGNYEWPSGINYSYMRFYVPKNSKILAINNFDNPEYIKKGIDGMLYQESNAPKINLKDIYIGEEKDKKVIGLWQVLSPQEEKIAAIVYEEPGSIWKALTNNSYQIYLQKQAGTLPQKTNVQIQGPIFSKPKLINEDITEDQNGRILSFDFDLDRDKSIQIDF